MEPPFGPLLVQIGPLSIYWYGFLIATGILLGARVATYLSERAGENPETIWDMMVIVVVFALIGARAYHVFSQPQAGLGWDYYRENPLQVFAIWNGGLGIYGALLGGALGTAIFAYFRNLNVLRWLDFLAPGMALGQSIGRWGNYMNRELYGPPTDLPWGLRIPPASRIPPYTDLAQYPESIRFHPTFLYESLATLALCVILIWVAERLRDRLHNGDILFGYIIGYAIIRFFIEFLRPDAWMLGPIAAAQVFAILLAILSAGFLVVRHRVGGRQARP